MSMPERLARASARHPWRTVAVWIVVLAAAAVCSRAFLSGALTTQSSFADNPESVRAQNLIEQRLTGPAKDTELVVVRSPVLTVSSPRFAGFVTSLRSAILAMGPAVVVTAPDYLMPGEPFLVSKDGHATLIPVTFARNFDNATTHIARLDAITQARQQRREQRQRRGHRRDHNEDGSRSQAAEDAVGHDHEAEQREDHRHPAEQDGSAGCGTGGLDGIEFGKT